MLFAKITIFSCDRPVIKENIEIYYKISFDFVIENICSFLHDPHPHTVKFLENKKVNLILLFVRCQ